MLYVLYWYTLNVQSPVPIVNALVQEIYLYKFFNHRQCTIPFSSFLVTPKILAIFWSCSHFLELMIDVMEVA